jgi:hypothetical protein
LIDGTPLRVHESFGERRTHTPAANDY